MVLVDALRFIRPTPVFSCFVVPNAGMKINGIIATFDGWPSCRFHYGASKNVGLTIILAVPLSK